MDPDELERRLATRTAELTAAQRRIGELLENAAALKETKRKLAMVRQERDALRGSLEYRLGRKLVGPFRRLFRALRGSEPESKQDPRRAYHRWFLAHRASPAELDAVRAAEREMPRTLISILMPVRDPQLPMLEEAVASVRAQVYLHWELLIADDGSADRAVSERLRAFAAADTRIRVKCLEAGSGPAAASNAALDMASGEFAGLLDPTGLLEADALLQIARSIQETAEADIVYCDEDEVDEEERFQEPIFKPDWSPDALLSDNYLGRFTVVRRKLIAEAGGFRPGFEGALDYDLMLRATEKARRILHVPKVLFHLHAGELRQPASEGGARALGEALSRRGIEGGVAAVGGGAGYRVRRTIARPEKIAIIIPTRDRLGLLERCVDGIVARTDYPRYEIVIVDNESKDTATLRYYEKLQHRVLRFPGPFNYSAINNYAVRQTDAPWILFLNNDTEVIEADWLSSMAEHIQRPEVGAVGAKLLFPDQTVQHAGVLLAEKPTVAHAFWREPADSMANGGQLQMTRNYSAVTAACMLTRRAVFEQVGGFDERELAVTYNDVDYCLKLGRAGYLIVYTPFARLYHHESASRGRGTSDPAEGRILRARWPEAFRRDPYAGQRAFPPQGA